MTTLAEVLAQHEWSFAMRACCCKAMMARTEWPAHVAEAIAAAGLAVIQLPDEPTIDHHDLQNGGLSEYHEFSDGSDTGTVGTYPGSGIIYSPDGWEWTPEGARTVAANWLAAAAAAEAVES